MSNARDIAKAETRFVNTSGDTMTGALQVDNIQNASGSAMIQWVDLTPSATEFSWSGGTVSSQKTFSDTNIPNSARYILCDVFVTASSSDHQNINLGRTSGDTNAKQNWVNVRGQQPSAIFASGLPRNTITLTYNGESDGYTPNYGVWYSSQFVPCSGRTFYFGNYGNSGSNGWVYIITRAYSL